MGPTFWQSSERRPRDVGLLFALLIVLLGLRMPTVLFQGRIWAEEGSVFLHNALNMEWRQALLQPEGGYLNLVANVASLIGAHLMPLESVRYVGPIVGIIFQVIPLVVAGTGTITWLRTSAALFALVLIIALSPTSRRSLVKLASSTVPSRPMRRPDSGDAARGRVAQILPFIDHRTCGAKRAHSVVLAATLLRSCHT